MHMFCADWLADEINSRPTKSSDFDMLKESMSERCVEPWLRATLRSGGMVIENYIEVQE